MSSRVVTAWTPLCPMRDSGADEAVLETEVTNTGALRLYEGLGFVRDKRLPRYYLNGNDAFRLKVWFHDIETEAGEAPGADGEEGGDGAEADGQQPEQEGDAASNTPAAVEVA